MTGQTTKPPMRNWLRLESLAILILCVGLYARIGAPWWLFAAAFLAPDLSFAGYLFGGRVGAWTYNLAHNEVGPVVLGLVRVVAGAHADPAGADLGRPCRVRPDTGLWAQDRRVVRPDPSGAHWQGGLRKGVIQLRGIGKARR